MSRTNAVTTPYHLVFTPEVQRQWEQVPQRNRNSLHRVLLQLAWAVGQRQWVGEQEADELFSLNSGPYELHYHLEPDKRTLVVKLLRKGEVVCR